MSAVLDRWLTRLYHTVGAALFLALCAVVSYTAGDGPRPYRVRAAELLRTTGPGIRTDLSRGPAPIVDGPSAVCTWVRRILARRPDTVAPCRVTCMRRSSSARPMPGLDASDTARSGLRDGEGPPDLVGRDP